MLELAATRGHRLIMHVNLAFVDAYRSLRATQLTRRGQPPMPRTIMNETVQIRMFVNFALSRKMISDDPLAGLKIPKVKSCGQVCWTPNEIASILGALDGPYRDVFAIWAETGMRFAEVAGLEWNDIDFANNVILLRPKDGWRPKNGEERAVPMSPGVRSMLAARPREFRWVYTMQPSTKFPLGDHQLQESRLLAYLKRRLEQLGLGGMIHSFRHSFITNARVAGTPEAIVRQWVGHLDREVTKIYTHILSPDSQAAMARLKGGTKMTTAGGAVAL